MLSATACQQHAQGYENRLPWSTYPCNSGSPTARRLASVLQRSGLSRGDWTLELARDAAEFCQLGERRARLGELDTALPSCGILQGSCLPLVWLSANLSRAATDGRSRKPGSDIRKGSPKLWGQCADLWVRTTGMRRKRNTTWPPDAVLLLTVVQGVLAMHASNACRKFAMCSRIYGSRMRPAHTAKYSRARVDNGGMFAP